MDLQQLPIQQKPIERKHSISENGHWLLFSLRGRVDSFNFNKVEADLLKIAKKSPERLALEFKEADFLCIPFIKLMSKLGDELNEKGLKLPIVAPSEKLKRQIDIFASLDEMAVFRSLDELVRRLDGYKTSENFRMAWAL